MVIVCSWQLSIFRTIIIAWHKQFRFCRLWVLNTLPLSSQHSCTYVYYSDVIIGTMASYITGITIVFSTVYSGADQRKHQSSTSMGFVRGIHRWPVHSPRKWPVTRKMFPFDDVIMALNSIHGLFYKHQLQYQCNTLNNAGDVWCDVFFLLVFTSYVLSMLLVKYLHLWNNSI